MANEEHIAILKQGVETWNAWRPTPKSIRIDSPGIVQELFNLRDADLRGAELRACQGRSGLNRWRQALPAAAVARCIQTALQNLRRKRKQATAQARVR